MIQLFIVIRFTFILIIATILIQPVFADILVSEEEAEQLVQDEGVEAGTGGDAEVLAKKTS